MDFFAKSTPIFFIITESVLEFFILTKDALYINSASTSFTSILLFFWKFTYFYTFLLYGYASFMNPGYLKLSWISEVQKDPTYKEELDDNGERSFCAICNMPRPLRAHHCSVCKKCVVLMDHHCDFIGNCVGYRNYKAFFVFLLEYPIHCILSLFVSIYGFFLSPKSISDYVLLVISLLFFVVVGFIVVMQLIPQANFIYHNTTWIEESGRQKRESLYRRARTVSQNRYDTLSLYQNLQQRLGDNPLMWLIPTPNTGNPYKFPQNPHYVPVYELNFSNFFQDDNENSPLLPAARLRTVNILGSKEAI